MGCDLHAWVLAEALTHTDKCILSAQQCSATSVLHCLCLTSLCGHHTVMSLPHVCTCDLWVQLVIPAVTRLILMITGCRGGLGCVRMCVFGVAGSCAACADHPTACPEMLFLVVAGAPSLTRLLHYFASDSVDLWSPDLFHTPSMLHFLWMNGVLCW